MRCVLLLVAVLVSACMSPSGTLSSATPGPTAPASAAISSPAPQAFPTRLPGSVVRLSVNGIEQPINTGLRDAGDGPVTIILTFPFAMDRPSVDQWGLPGSAVKTWIDDRTLRIVFSETESSLNFKMAELKSASGDAVIDFINVSVTFPATRVVSVFTIAELTGSRSPRPALSWRIRSDDGTTLSPDAKRVLIYDGFAPYTGQVTTLVELDSKKRIPLAQPPVSDGWFSFADWMADGRLVMVGRGVWVGDADANGMMRIADASAAVSGYAWVGLPDPLEKRIALWGYNADGHIAVVDLATGAVRKITGPFRRCAADGAASFAWSTDGRLLAGTDCDTEEGPVKGRVRIVDVAADRTLRTIDGGVYRIDGLPSGNFMLVRDSGEVGAGQRLLGLVIGFDGQERSRYLGGGWRMSPNGRYLLENWVSPAGCCGYTLFDLVAGTSSEFVVPSSGQSDGGRTFPHWLRDGRLAFY
jgi:hypothetical protein